IRENGELRIYGSGIVSSSGESVHCPASDAPNRIGCDLGRIMRTRYRIDSYQKTYFVRESSEQWFEAARPDLAPIDARPARAASLPAGTVLAGDRVFNRGTGEGWASDGDV